MRAELPSSVTCQGRSDPGKQAGAAPWPDERGGNCTRQGGGDTTRLRHLGRSGRDGGEHDSWELSAAPGVGATHLFFAGTCLLYTSPSPRD